MIRAIFFDWFNTLVRYEPPRYQLHTQACHEFGIEVSSEAMMRGVLVADASVDEGVLRALHIEVAAELHLDGGHPVQADG